MDQCYSGGHKNFESLNRIRAVSCVIQIPRVDTLNGGAHLDNAFRAHALDWERYGGQIEFALVQLFTDHFYHFHP